jgi:protein disulfide-isomerase A6
MKAFAVLACVLFASVVSADDPTVSLPGVSDLTPDNFDKIVNGAKHALVEFYAPWCGHCKRMTSEYKTLGEMIKGDAKLSSRVVIAKVDADAHRSLGERFGVRGFPTIKYFARGKPITADAAQPYEGARTSDKFLEFIKAKLDEDKGFARVEVLDKLAQKFIADGADLKAVLKEAEKAAGKAEKDVQDNAKLYVTFMKRAVDKGTEYFATELARLERMIGSGSVSAAKLDEMSRKTSVLSAFTEKVAAKAEEDDVDEE